MADKIVEKEFKKSFGILSQDLYKLDENNNPIPCSLIEWGALYESEEGNNKRRVEFDVIDDYSISTVFLGLDHSYFDGPPILFETMVFPKEGDEIYCDRYSTWDEAVKGHQTAINWVKSGCKDE